MTTWNRAFLSAFVGLLLTATTLHSAPQPGFRLAAQTEHFSFYVKGKEKVSPEKSERFLAKVEGLLGAKVEGHGAYYRHADAQAVEYSTGMYRDGATNLSTGEIHSTKDYHPHEIVHFALSQIGSPGLFFHEGLAVMIAEKGKLRGKKVDTIAKRFAGNVPFSTFVDAFASLDPNVSYAVAASFTKLLIERHGMARVVEFVRSCDGAEKDRDMEFARVFGQSLAQAGNDWAAQLSGHDKGTQVAADLGTARDSSASRRIAELQHVVAGATAKERMSSGLVH
jgi:hypothetical protein